MLTRTLLAAVSAIALSAGAYGQQGGGGGERAGGAGGGGAAAPSASPSGSSSANAGGADSARDVAPGQMKGAGQSARDEAPGRNKTGQSARDGSPGQTKDSGASGASDGASGSDKAADKATDKRSDTGKRSDKNLNTNDKADRKADNKDKADRKASDRDDASKDRADRRDNDAAKDRAAGSDKDRDPNRNTADRERDRTGDRGATGASAGEAGKIKAKSLTNVTQEQRTKVKSVFVKHRDSAIVRDVGVSINVGVALPRSVRLHRVPSDIIAIVPDYSDYEYFVYENKVVIVDPDTFEIVDIIILA